MPGFEPGFSVNGSNRAVNCVTTTAPCHNQLLPTQVPPRYSSKKKYPMKVSFSDLKLWGPHNKLVIIIDNIY